MLMMLLRENRAVFEVGGAARCAAGNAVSCATHNSTTSCTTCFAVPVKTPPAMDRLSFTSFFSPTGGESYLLRNVERRMQPTV
jgi:hypothetical protein